MPSSSFFNGTQSSKFYKDLLVAPDGTLMQTASGKPLSLEAARQAMVAAEESDEDDDYEIIAVVEDGEVARNEQEQPLFKRGAPRQKEYLKGPNGEVVKDKSGKPLSKDRARKLAHCDDTSLPWFSSVYGG